MARSRIGRIAGLVILALVGATILLLATPRHTVPPASPPSPSLLASAATNPPSTAIPSPNPTTVADVNGPLPIGWDQLVLPRLAAPWALGDVSPKGYDWVAVLRRGSTVGGVMLSVYLPAAFPSYDLRAEGLGAVRELARDDLQKSVDDRGVLGDLRVEPEPIREIPVAGTTGVRTAFSDIEIATSRVVGRYVVVYVWYGGAMWLFQTFWPPDPEGAGPIAFGDLEDEVAFDPVLDKLLAEVRLPSALPSPLPVSP